MPRRHRVLIVEDDALIRDSLADVLSDAGYEAITAANGKEGLELLRTAELPCVILLDLMMPVMNGAEFLRELRNSANVAATPVVIVSAWENEAQAVEGAAQGFVKKPVRLDLLLEQLSRHCDPASGASDGGEAA